MVYVINAAFKCHIGSSATIALKTQYKKGLKKLDFI